MNLKEVGHKQEPAILFANHTFTLCQPQECLVICVFICLRSGPNLGGLLGLHEAYDKGKLCHT